MQTIIAIFIFALIFIAIAVMVIINFTYRSFKKMRQAMEDSYYRNQKIKEQKEKNPFDNDYFKSSKGRQRQSRTQAQYEQREQTKRDKNPFGDDYFKSEDQSQADKKDTARRTSTSSGVTIIDDRDTDDKRKIFENNDGEYVEFEEVDN